MRSILKAATLCVLTLLALPSAGRTQTSGPEEIAKVFMRAWNAHDMKSFGEVLSDDVDWVTVAGAQLKGRSEAVSFLDKEQSGWAKTTTMTPTDVTIRPLGAEAGTVRLDWEITGIVDRDGQPAPPARGTNLFVILKQAGDWKIVTGQVALRRSAP